MFFIVSRQRSGTHFVGSLLASHPDVSMYGEVLNNGAAKFSFYDFWGERVSQNSELIRPHHMIAAWRDFVAEKTAPTAKSGAIIMYNQLDTIPSVLARRILGASHIVHLVRQNVLRTLVSEQINRQTDKPPHQRGEDGNLTQITLSSDTLVENLRKRLSEIETFRERAKSTKCLEITYEDFTRDPNGSASKIFSFIGVDPQPVRTGYKRSNPQPLREIIINYEETRELLSKADLVHFLEQDDS